jgi:hypothetical protein
VKIKLTDLIIDQTIQSYSELAIREYGHGPLDPAAAYKLRNDKLAMFASVREALSDGVG